MTAPDDDVIDARLQACLDERRNPLDDTELCSLLVADPARLEAFSRLHAALRALPQRSSPRPRARWPVAVAAAAVALLLVLVYRRQEAAPQPRILWAQLSETSPRAWLVADVTARQPVLRTTTTRIECYERRSSRR